MSVKIVVKDDVLQAVVKRMGALDRVSVEVGVLASKGGHEDHDGITMVELAAVHELGSPANNIPSRSFIGGTLKKRPVQRRMSALMAKLATKLIEGKITNRQALDLIGKRGVEEIKKRIMGEGVPPALKPATVARKGHSRALVDTGRLVDAISYEVK